MRRNPDNGTGQPGRHEWRTSDRRTRSIFAVNVVGVPAEALPEPPADGDALAEPPGAVADGVAVPEVAVGTTAVRDDADRG